jgi:cytidylate kinase
MTHEPMKRPNVITIDGPSGSGKGTLAARLAVHYGYNLLDSGALYRLLGLKANQQGLFVDGAFQGGVTLTEQLIDLALHLDIQFVPNQDQQLVVLLDGQDVTQTIRTEQAGSLASQVAVIPEVRVALLQRQHDFAVAPGLVADGRDMGTVVFTDAPAKIYLTASAVARAERRVNQLRNMAIDANISDILSDIEARDRRDTERAVAPLKPAEDALIVDSSSKGIEEVFTELVRYIDSKIFDSKIFDSKIFDSKIADSRTQ